MLLLKTDNIKTNECFLWVSQVSSYSTCSKVVTIIIVQDGSKRQIPSNLKNQVKKSGCLGV